MNLQFCLISGKNTQACIHTAEIDVHHAQMVREIGKRSDTDSHYEHLILLQI